MTGAPRDPALEALDRLCEAVGHAQGLLVAVEQRAGELQRLRAERGGWREVVAAEEPPLVVEMVSEVLDRLAEAGAQFRRAEARALSQEGLSHEAIAALFGVTRQRVGALLQDPARRPAP